MDDRSPDAAALPSGSSALLSVRDESDCRPPLLDALGRTGPETGVLLVATSEPDELVVGLRRRGVAPDAIGVVDATAGDSGTSGVAEQDSVAGPGSLSALGIATSDLLERLSHRFDRVVVALDATTPILAATALPATFRFLHVLGGRVRAADAVLLAGFDRSSHDEETERTISQLFDQTVVVE